MEELEVKFHPRSALFADLSARCTPLTKRFTDVYYEGAGYPLTTRDMWLRHRDDELELKWPAAAATAAAATASADASAGAAPSPAARALRPVDHYNESTGLSNIAATLLQRAGIVLPAPPPLPGGASGWLAAGGLRPFVALTTQRSRFALLLAGSRVFVDLDRVAFPPPPGGGLQTEYMVGEVELVEAAPGRAPREALGAALAALGVDGERPVRGKVLEYLATHDADHWRALSETGLLTAKLGKGWQLPTK